MAIHAPSRRQHAPRPRPRSTPARRPPEQSQVLDRGYWIEHSIGYQVHEGRRRIGFVEATRPDPLEPGRTLLTICAGVLGRRHVVVRSEDVSAIVPPAERVWLRTGASSLA